MRVVMVPVRVCAAMPALRIYGEFVCACRVICLSPVQPH